MKKFFLTIAALLWVIVSIAQTQGVEDQHHATVTAQHEEHGEHMHQTNPYAGTSAGLSDAQRAQYLNGEGMGFAKPAELNHYPGPRHVLQNAVRMRLSPEQIAATQKLFDSVQQKAKELGQQIVDREDELAQLFASHNADETRVKRLTAEIGTLQGELRAAHLTAHLKERSLLSTEQVQTYDEVRDYVPGEKPASSVHPH